MAHLSGCVGVACGSELPRMHLLPGSSVNRKAPLADKGRSSHNARRATDVYRERRPVRARLSPSNTIPCPARTLRYSLRHLRHCPAASRQDLVTDHLQPWAAKQSACLLWLGTGLFRRLGLAIFGYDLRVLSRLLRPSRHRRFPVCGRRTRHPRRLLRVLPRGRLRSFGRGTLLPRVGGRLVDEALGVLGGQRPAEPRVLSAPPVRAERRSGPLAPAVGTVRFRLAVWLAIVPFGEHLAGMVGSQFSHCARCRGRDELKCRRGSIILTYPESRSSENTPGCCKSRR